MKHEITCPKCSYEFALDEALNRDIELEVRKELSDAFARKEAELRAQLEREVKERVSGEGAQLRIQLKAQTAALKDLRQHEKKLLKSQTELQERAEKAELEAARKVAAERELIRQKAQEQVLEEHRLKDAEKNKQLEDMRHQIEELKRKAEQGSQQLQGDVQEVELEKELRENFPRDQIEAVKTGQRGADILHKVVSDSGQVCGSILWESKRQKHWSDGWIKKLLEDKEEAKADLAVIVTDVLPADVVHLGAVRGVLLTTFPLAPCLAATLRVNIALLGQTRLALGGQDDQKSRVFQYFTSPQFTARLNSIAEHFHQMQEDLTKEKSAMTRYWARREKQISTISLTTAAFAGELKALYGQELPPLPQFQLPGVDEDNSAAA